MRFEESRIDDELAGRIDELAPSDDYNYQIKLLGPKKHKETLQVARRLVRTGKGKELMHAA